MVTGDPPLSSQPGGLSAPSGARQARPTTTEPARLERVLVRQRPELPAIGSLDSVSEGWVRDKWLKERPVLRAGEVLEWVPGMLVTQHSGDGKANQYFLRGFNLDHGTDFHTWLEGLPINMVSHGHGQGYADLNSLMPELLASVSYRKGPYHAQAGDLSLVGSADLRYTDRLPADLASLQMGAHGYRRLMGAWSRPLSAHQDDTQAPVWLVALSGARNDGPWQVPEGLRQGHLVASLSSADRGERWRAVLQSYRAHWTATNQVPLRWIEGSGQGDAAVPHDRFASLDASDGGHTRREGLSVSGSWPRWPGPDEAWPGHWSAYALSSDLVLWTNATYRSSHADLGDQLHQADHRRTAGWRSELGLPAMTRWLGGEWLLGLDHRRDRIELTLADSAARQIHALARRDHVAQDNTSAWTQWRADWGGGWRSVLGLRQERLSADVRSATDARNSGQAAQSLTTPKLSLSWALHPSHELHWNAGQGFHSNDARGALTRVDPRSQETTTPVPLLAPGWGRELGWRAQWTPSLQTTLAAWRLDLGSELVYVGDSGSTEAKGPSHRRGLELNLRWSPSARVLVDADVSLSRARSEDPAAPYLPNAVSRVASLGASYTSPQGWSSSVAWRALGRAPLSEDGRVWSPSSVTTQWRLSWRQGGGEWRLEVFNLFNRRVNDITYWYASRLPGEAQDVEDFHVHPAEPRSVRLGWQGSF